MKFIVKYIVVAIVATAVTYFGTPYLKPWLSKSTAASPEDGAVSGDLDSDDLALRSLPDSSGDDAATGDSRASAHVVFVTPHVTVHTPIARQAHSSSADTADASDVPASRPMQKDTTDQDVPVASTDKIPQSAGSGAVVAWGIAVRDADVTLTGGRKARIAAGTLVEETATVGEGDNEASVCSVWSDGRWNGPARVAVTDLFRVPGTREDVDSEAVELLARFYHVKNEVAGLEKKAVDPARAAIDANPHAEEYRRLYREHQAFQEKAKRLTAERDLATGSKRMKIADELRAMQHEGRELDNKIKAIDAKYKAWKKAHANDLAITAQADDPRLESLRAELSELSAKVAPFGAR